MSSVYSTSREMFEQRMRARRVATCLAVARSAVASGKLGEAIERLEEACALDPDASEPRLLLEELRGQETAEVPEARPRPARSEAAALSHWLAAGIAVCALAALAFLWPWDRPDSNGRTQPAQFAPTAPQQPPPAAVTGNSELTGLAVHLEDAVGTSGASGQPPGVAAGTGRNPDDFVGIQLKEQPVVEKPLQAPPGGNADAAGAQQPDPAQSRSSDNGAVAAPPNAEPRPPSDARLLAPPPPAATSSTQQGGTASAAATTSAAVPIVPAPPAPSAGQQLPPLDRVPVNAEDLSRVVPSEAMAASQIAPASSRAADVPAEASLRIGASDAAEIEGTLRRYADAYARLDASAARAVWPTVDERALARAFEGLESQGIVFDHCDVAVDGSEATAACRGRAHFVPKVGSREPLFVRRQWSFRLHKADAGWEIVRADAR